MPDRGRLAAVSVIGGYNLIQNLLLSRRAYVPANLITSLGLVALARRYGCSWDELGLTPSRARSGFRLGMAGFLGAAAAAVAASLHRATRGLLLDERAAGQRRGDVAFRTLIRFPLGTALFEEVAFRGVVEAMWRHSGSSRRTAAAAAAATFGIWHLIPADQALPGNPLGPRFGTPKSRALAVLSGALLAGLSSLGFSLMRERSGSLIAPWMAHSAINSALYLAGVAAWWRAAIVEQ